MNPPLRKDLTTHKEAQALAIATLAFGTSDDIGKLLLRVAVGSLMVFHGIAKVRLGVDWIVNIIASAGYPGYLAYAVFLGEILAPVLMIIGYRTRLAAAMVAIDVIVAVLVVYCHQVFSIKPMGGGYAIELETLFLAGALALLLFGGGKYGLSRGTGPWD